MTNNSKAPWAKFEISVCCKNRQWLQYKNIEKFLKETCQKIVQNTEIVEVIDHRSILELSISLVSAAQIKKINHQFRNKNLPTDILSFGAIDEAVIRNSGLKIAIEDNRLVVLGDLVIALEVVEREAKAQKKLFFQHLTHLLTHGILHLIGYDHEEDKMAEEMEKKEVKILQKFQIANPYLLNSAID